MCSKMRYEALEDIYLLITNHVIFNNYFTSFHIVCEDPHDNVLFASSSEGTLVN